MEERDIEKYLLELTPTEHYLQKWYQQHHRLIRMDEFTHLIAEIYQMQTSSPMNPLSGIMAEYSGFSNDSNFYVKDDVLQIRQKSVQEDQSILIQKQTRYAPVVISDTNSIIISYAYHGSGAFLLRSGSGKTTEIKLVQGNFLFLPPPFRGAHKIESDDCVILAIAINKDAMSKLISHIFPDGVIRNFYIALLSESFDSDALIIHSRDDSFIKSSLHQIIMENISDSAGSAESITFCQLLLTTLLAYIQKNYGDDAPLLKNGKFLYSVPSMYLYIKNHFANFSLEEMANTFSYSKSYMSRYYKKMSGVSISKSLQDIQIETAENELCHSHKSIDEIAQDIGYKDTSYFIEAFKKKNKMTPLQYRKKQYSKASN